MFLQGPSLYLGKRSCKKFFTLNNSMQEFFFQNKIKTKNSSLINMHLKKNLFYLINESKLNDRIIDCRSNEVRIIEKVR